MKTKKFHSIPKKFTFVLLFILFALSAQGVKTVQSQDATGSTGEGSLNLAQVDIIETPELTAVRGLDSDGREVGRLELVHGNFEMSEIFAEDRDDRNVTGRRLEVGVFDQRLSWETEGFWPTLSLPAVESSDLAAFLEDARVKPVLERWGIGFQVRPNKKDDGPFVCDLVGTHPYDCSGQTKCPTLMNRIHPDLFVPNSCGGSIAADAAWTVHQRRFAGYYWDEWDSSVVGDPVVPVPPGPEYIYGDQSFIAQCCRMPGQDPIYAKKSCPDSLECSNTHPCLTTCGAVKMPGRCVGCPSESHNLTNGKCVMHVQNAGWADPDAPHGSKAVYEVCARYDWTCGDGTCDVDEDCLSCAADCACNGTKACVASIASGGKARCCDKGHCGND